MRTKKRFTFKSIAVALCAVVLLGLFPANALAWKFIVYGDTRSNDDDHEDALQVIKDEGGDYEFIINVGDVVGDGTVINKWNRWENSMVAVMGETMQDENGPFYISCPGNHDNTEQSSALTNWNNYLSYQATHWPENDGLWFYFDFNNARFIVLDDEKRTPEQLSFLQDAIETNTQEWLFAIWHAPTIPYGDKEYDAGIHRDFNEVLYQGGCDIIYNGDAHTYARTKKLKWDGPDDLPTVDNINGTTQIITGNSGADRDGFSDSKELMPGANTLLDGNHLEDNRVGMTLMEIIGDQLNLKHYLYNSGGASILDQANYTPNDKNFCVDCPVNYTLSTNVIGSGSVSPSDGSFEEGTVVTLTATPATGWYFESWSGDATGTDLSVNVTMDANKTITATFIEAPPVYYTLTTSTDGVGTGSVSPSSGTYAEGTVVTLSAIADAGSVFSSWGGDASGTNPTTTITMDANKSVVATFDEQGPITEVTLGATDDAYVLDNSVNTNTGTLPNVSIKNETRKVGLIKFDLSSISSTVISATLQLTGNNAATGGNVNVYSIVNDSWNESTVTYSSVPAKGNLLGTSSLGAEGTVYNIDITNFVIGESNGDKVVSLWLNDELLNDTRYDFASKEAVGDIGPKLILEVEAGTQTTYTLTTSAVNGTVAPTGGTYNAGTVVTLTATPDAGYIFSNWSGDAGGTVNPINVTMDSDKNITAVFAECCNNIITNLTPTDDAYVKSTVANSNFGANVELRVNADNKQAFIKFDVSTIGTVSSAELQLTPVTTEGVVEVWKVDNDAWNEGTVTWNTKPSPISYIGTMDIAAGITSVSVANFVEAQALLDDAATFALIETLGRNTFFSSKEGIGSPVLVVEHDDIPKTAIDAVSTDIKLFPNPTTGIVNISIDDVEFTNGIVNIYSAHGALIETVSIDNAVTTVQVNQASGLYLMEIIYNDKVQVTPVVKE